MSIEQILIGEPDRGRAQIARGIELEPISELTILARGVKKAATRGLTHDRNQSLPVRSEFPCKTEGIHTLPLGAEELAEVTI